MRRPGHRFLRAAAVAGAALLLVGCGTDEISPTPPASSVAEAQPSTATAPKPGGTIYILAERTQEDQLDPQRVYTGNDMALFGATIYRSLVSYRYSSDASEAVLLVPDMATDIGRMSTDARTWSFTLKDGVKWQDGSPVTCEDFKYGVSRTFATDVINQGPTYAIAYLDIPANDDGTSQYPGPYKATPDQQALYDKAVTCDGNTITFNLNQPVADFNYTVTLGFFAVPRALDTGESYGSAAPFPASNGPYQIATYEPGIGGRLVLVRNPSWDPASDPVRKAYPDRWEVDFGLSPQAIDERLMASRGDDAFAIQDGRLQPQDLPTIFADATTPNAEYAGRAISVLDSGAWYYFVNVNKVPNVKIRQAMAVALDRAAIRLTAGGVFAGDMADGLISPNLGDQYAPTGMWTGLLGQELPDNGDPGYARQLIEASGEAAPRLTFDYPQLPSRAKEAAIVKASLEKAGFQVELNPIEQSEYYGFIFAPTAHEFGLAAWAPDWPNASTVIPPLTTPMGGWDASHVCDPTCGAADDPEWLTKVDAALLELDRPTQARLWQDLNQEAMERFFGIPTRFDRGQFLAGSKVKPVYNWAPYGTWPYGEMYVAP